MPENLTIAAYIVAGVLFILSLGGLSAQESARRGNAFGIAGMLIAVAVTTLAHLANGGVLAAAVGIGGIVGAVLASRVEMTSMPELVAILHSFVGLAAGARRLRQPPDAGAHRRRRARPPPGRGLRRRLRGIAHVRRIHHRVRKAPRIAAQQARALAGPALAERHSSPRLRGDGWSLLGPPAARRAGTARGPGRDRRVHRDSPRDGHRRRRHARRGLDAQQLLRVGRGRRGLHAVERPAHHHGSAGRLERGHPQLHHVSGDESLVHQRHLGRIRRRRGRPTSPLLDGASRGGDAHHRGRDGRSAARRKRGHRRAGVRDGGRPRPISASTAKSQIGCASAASTSGASPSIRSPERPLCPAT